MHPVRLNSNGKYWNAVWKVDGSKDGRQGLGLKANLTREDALLKCIDIQESMDFLDVPTLNEWVDTYLTYRPELSRATEKLYYRTVNLMVEYFGNVLISDITPAQATKFSLWLAQSMNPGAVGAYIRNCKALLGDNYGAMRYELIKSSPFRRVSGTAPAPVKDWRRLNRHEVDALVGECQDMSIKACMALCAYAGLRLHEATSLRWGDIKFNRNMLIATTTKKTGNKPKSREVLMVPELHTIMSNVRPLVDGDGPCMIANRYAYDGAITAMSEANLEPWKQPYRTLRRWRVTSWRESHDEWIVNLWMGHSAVVSATHYLTVPTEIYNEHGINPHSNQRRLSISDRPGNNAVGLRLVCNTDRTDHEERESEERVTA